MATEGMQGLYAETGDDAATATFWAVTEAVVLDPDGRGVSLQAPLPPDAKAGDAAAHQAEKTGHA